MLYPLEIYKEEMKVMELLEQWRWLPSRTRAQVPLINYLSYVFNAVMLSPPLISCVKEDYWPHSDSEWLQCLLLVPWSILKLFSWVVSHYILFFLPKSVYFVCYWTFLPESIVIRRCSTEMGNLDSNPHASLLEPEPPVHAFQEYTVIAS